MQGGALQPKQAIVGIEQANYSSLTGDVVICALYLSDLSTKAPRDIRFARDMSVAVRRELFGWLQEASIYSIQLASIPDIGTFGDHEARTVAVGAAVAAMQLRLKPLLLEPTFVCGEDLALALKIHGDGINYKLALGSGRQWNALACASVVAKVYSDALLYGWDSAWLGYGIAKDQGLPSEDHRQALIHYGPSPIHRAHNYRPEWWADLFKPPLD